MTRHTKTRWYHWLIYRVAGAKEQAPTSTAQQVADAVVSTATIHAAVATLPALRVFPVAFPRPHLPVIVPGITPAEPFLFRTLDRASSTTTRIATTSLSPVEVDSGVDVDLAAVSAESVAAPTGSSTASEPSVMDSLTHDLSLLRWPTNGEETTHMEDSDTLQKYKEARRDRYVNVAEARREHHRKEIKRREEERLRRRQVALQRSGLTLAHGPATISSHRVKLEIGEIQS